MSRILIPRSDSVSAKVIEPSDFEEMNSHVQDHIKSGFTVTAGSGLAANVAAGKISLKGLYVNNTATEAVIQIIFMLFWQEIVIVKLNLGH